MAQASKKILYVIWSLDQGGAEQVVMNLAQTLNGKDFEPVICCLNEPGRYAPSMCNAGIKVHALHKKGKVDIACVRKLVSLIKREKIDLVHTHLFTANLWGRFAARLANVPCVITDHNVDTWKKRHHFIIDWFLLRWTSSAVCVSKNVREFYERKVAGHGKKSIVIYNGIDVEKFRNKAQHSLSLRESLNLGKNAILLGSIGRLVPQKAHKDFVDCVRILKQSVNQNVHGVIVGEGPEQRQIQEYIDKKSLRGSVHLMGFRQNMSEIYADLDFFVLPSYREGFPMAILEAMASRIPVIATNVGGVAECLIHNSNGVMVEPRKPGEIAKSVAELIGDSRFRQSVTQQAYSDVMRKYSNEVMTENHKNLYLHVIGNRGLAS